MSVIYSGQTITNTIVSGASQTGLNSALKDALLGVGWSVIKDGSSDNIWRLRSGTTPQGNSGDLWLWTGTLFSQPVCIFAASSSLCTGNTQYGTSGGPQLQTPTPLGTNSGFGAGVNYQLFANPYWFFLCRTITPCPSGQSYFFSVPYVTPNLTGLISSINVAMGSNSSSLTLGRLTFAGENYAWGYLNGQGQSSGSFHLHGWTSSAAPTWFDQSREFYEPRIIVTPVGGAAAACGFQWDMLIHNSPVPRNTTISYDGSTWLVITESIDPALWVKIG